MRFAREAAAFALVMFSTILLIPHMVSANIHVEPRLEDPISGILALTCINFTADLFLIALAVSVAFRVKGKRMGDIPQGSSDFVLSIFETATAVAVAGGVIDFFFLYERVEDHYALRSLSAEIVIPAATLIFVTILASLYAFVRIRPGICMVAGAAIAPLSPIGWYITAYLFASPFLFSAVAWTAVSGVLAIVLVLNLRSFHGRVISGEKDRAYEGGRP